MTPDDPPQVTIDAVHLSWSTVPMPTTPTALPARRRLPVVVNLTDDDQTFDELCELGFIPADDPALIDDAGLPDWTGQVLSRHRDGFAVAGTVSAGVVILDESFDDERWTVTVLDQYGCDILDRLSFPRTVTGRTMLFATLTAAVTL